MPDSMPDMFLASTTATKEELAHAASADWRKPFPVEVTPEHQVDTEAPATSEEEVETAPASEPEPQQEEEKPVKGKGGFQKKIDKLTREKGEAVAAKDMLAQQLAEFKDRFERLEKRLAPEAETKVEKPEVKVEGKPLESEIGTKYKSWDEYNEALIDWKADQRLNARLAELDRTAQERESQETAEERDTNYTKTAKEFAEQMPDFNEAISNAAKAGMKLPEPIIELIKELPNGPAVTYYLVTNPEEALELIGMAPAMGFAAIGRISQGLEAEVKPKPKPLAPKPVSAAPAAVKPVAGHSARSGQTLQDISKSGTDEYVRARMRQIEERNAARRY